MQNDVNVKITNAYINFLLNIMLRISILPIKLVTDKGKPAEKQGRKGAGPRQTDLGTGGG